MLAFLAEINPDLLAFELIIICVGGRALTFLTDRSRLLSPVCALISFRVLPCADIQR
jgi:hypothetical protein